MLKNNEEITAHLQRIFIYGDEMAEESRVNSFVEFCRTSVNPYTKKSYDITARSFYRYISGDHQFPFDLVRPLIQWSLDAEFMAAYDFNVPMTEEARFKAKIEEIEKKKKALEEELEKMQSRLKK